MRKARTLACWPDTRRKNNEANTAKKLLPFSKNAQPVPTDAMVRPATAGPIMRAILNEVELSAMALDKSFSPTSSATKICRTGASNAEAQPDKNANTYTCHSCTMPVTVSTPRVSASTPIVAWVAISNLRWS